MAKGKGFSMPARGAKGRTVAPTQPRALPSNSEAPAQNRPRISPVQFFREVRAEGRKITWTTWKETWITSVMVLIMVVVTSIFFMVVDGALNFLVQQLLKLALA